jgi:hypothetical protein
MVFLTAGFARVFPEKRLELKSLKRQTKAEEEGPRLAQNGGTDGAPWGTGPFFKYQLVYMYIVDRPHRDIPRAARALPPIDNTTSRQVCVYFCGYFLRSAVVTATHCTRTAKRKVL